MRRALFVYRTTILEGAMINFETLKRTHKPNNYLVADRENCPNARADREPPVLAHPPATVHAAWEAVTARQARTIRTDGDSDTMTYEYVQRSALFRFPDTITIRFLDAGQGRTKLLIYSASKVGYSDMGVNSRRVSDWLSALEAELLA